MLCPFKSYQFNDFLYINASGGERRATRVNRLGMFAPFASLADSSGSPTRSPQAAISLGSPVVDFRGINWIV